MKIEKNIPIPESIQSGQRKYPFDEMEVGDSLYSDNKAMRQAAYAYGRRKGIKLITRKEGTGYRAWRIE